jgi:hypothetical protein
MTPNQHPSQSPEREALRNKHGVRIVTDQEEGQDVRWLPAGVYGFTGAPGAKELPLFAHPIVRSTEVHKTASGDVYLVGYVQTAEAQAIESGAEPVTVHLYPDPLEASSTLVAVPLSRVDHRQPPSRSEGNFMAVEIAPRS